MSFIRKATRSVIAGNPPADAAQPSGINGIMVLVVIMLAHAPRAPRIPSFLFQNPANKSAPNSHCETPKKNVAPRTPKTGYIQKIMGPGLMYGLNAVEPYRNHF